MQGSACTEICGDGYHIASNGCDDGNEIDLDGCSSDCEFEDGFYLKYNYS